MGSILRASEFTGCSSRHFKKGILLATLLALKLNSMGELSAPVALTLFLTLVMGVYEGFYPSQAPDNSMRLARYARVNSPLESFKW